MRGIVDTESIIAETENASVEYPINMHRTESDETNLVSEIPNTINE